MKNMKTYKNIVMATVLLGVNSFAFAADNNSSKEEKKKMEPPQFLGDRLPPYANINKYYVDVAFLYWQPDADGFDFGVKEQFELGVNLLPVSVEIEDHLNDGDLDFEWDPGFRIGFGKIWGDREQWDVFFNWTWFQSDADRTMNGEPTSINFIENSSAPTLTVNGTAGDGVVPSFSPFFSGGPAQQAKAKWRLEYNVIDIELGRNFFMGKTLTARPHFGVRGAWINQKIDVKYNSFLTKFNFSQPTSPTVIESIGPGGANNIFKGKNDFAAGGLRAGVDLYWNFGNNFCAFGKASGSILYGVIDVKEKFVSSSNINTNGEVTGFPDTTVPLDIEARLKDLVHRTRTNLQTSVGFMWHMAFNDDKQHLYISASYEVNEWFQLNQLRDINENGFFFLKTNRRNGDLGLHGVTFDVKAAF